MMERIPPLGSPCATSTTHRSTIRRAAALVACAVATGLAVLAVPAAGTVRGSNHAACQFDLRGTAGDNSVTPIPTPLSSQELRQTYNLSGPVTCTGTADGRSLPQNPGTMTAVGQDPTDPLSSNPDYTANSCAAGTWVFYITVSWRGGHHRTLSGEVRFTNASFDALLYGKLGGSPLFGHAGIGSDPDRPAGECTDQYPYTYWSLVGHFVLGTGLPTSPATPGVLGAANHQIFIQQHQYIGGGTVNGPNGMDPNISVSSGGLTVTQGDKITFANLDTHPHTVTSCYSSKCDPGGPAVTLPSPAPQLLGRQTDRCFDSSCASGVFDSDNRLDQTGGSYTVNTANLTPGTYYFFCEFHRFMRGSFTVVPR